MFEIILNATKLALSDDVRKSTSALLNLIRRSPEWKNDICTLEAKVQRIFAEQATILAGLTLNKLENLEYPNDAISAFNTTYHELTQNAFEHGCKSKKDSIVIVISITKEYVSLIVTNPKKNRFNLNETIEKCKLTLNNNPRVKRGRGLLLVNELADSFDGLPSNNGVKVVFYKNRVRFGIYTFDDLTIIETIEGLFNPSFPRRLISTALKYINNNLILNFNKWEAGSWAEFVTLEIDEIFSQSSKSIVALQPYSKRGEAILPESIVAYSWKEAFKKLYKIELLPKIESKLLSEWEREMERDLDENYGNQIYG